MTFSVQWCSLLDQQAQCPLSISVDLLLPSCLQLVAAMIRKHLSWLIVWGNLFGALLGLVAEIIVIVFSVTRTY